MTQTPSLKLVIVGHVDHGKSTLIGRLFHDTGRLPAERLAEIKAACAREGLAFELAYLMDALREERAQNITVDTAQSFFETEKRRYVLIDAPGHREFVKNMVTGAASADAAILLVDAGQGLAEQTRRHAFLLKLIGLKQVVVFINKLDLCGYAESRFRELEAEIRQLLATLGLTTLFVLPGSARDGVNVAARREELPWWPGPTLLAALDQIPAVERDEAAPLRLPIQDVFRRENRRIYAGRIEAGRLEVGQDVAFAPSGKRSKVSEILRWGQTDVRRAVAGQNVGVVFADELFVERGEVASALDEQTQTTQEFTASIFWLGKQPLVEGRVYGLRLATAAVPAEVVRIEEAVDSSTLLPLSASGLLEPLAVGRVRLRTQRPVGADLFASSCTTGRFVLVEGERVAGGGIIVELRPLERTAAATLVFDQSALAGVTELRGQRAEADYQFSPALLAGLANGSIGQFRFDAWEPALRLARVALAHDLSLELEPAERGAELRLMRRRRPEAAMAS